MKRIIPLIAVALAMAVPATMIAQTPDYYGYENDNLVDLVSWIEAGINAGFVTFDTQQHEDEFLALAATLHSTVDVGQCQNICAMLKQAAANIVGTNHRSIAIFLCESLIDAYTYTDAVLILPSVEVDAIHDALTNPPTEDEYVRDRTVRHVSDKNPQWRCTHWTDSDGGFHHIGNCDKIIIVDKKPT